MRRRDRYRAGRLQMKILLKALREIAYGIGVLLAAIIIGNLLYRLIGDFFPVSLDRSADAAQGAGMLFALLVLVIYVAVRLVRRKRLRPAKI